MFTSVIGVEGVMQTNLTRQLLEFLASGHLLFAMHQHHVVLVSAGLHLFKRMTHCGVCFRFEDAGMGWDWRRGARGDWTTVDNVKCNRQFNDD